MTTQQPIGSGYGADSTTTEVLAHLDLNGKLAVVTGASSDWAWRPHTRSATPARPSSPRSAARRRPHKPSPEPTGSTYARWT